jgi:hypothetical protein
MTIKKQKTKKLRGDDHRTKKHYLREVETKEAEQEIKDEVLQNQRRSTKRIPGISE